MKKYLINGVLALFAGFYLASCADTETDYVPIAEQKVKAFEEVFKEVYGEIDPHQNWGFTTDLTLADLSTAEIVYRDSVVKQESSTRGALTRGHNANANMWGRTYTNVPETLTVAQKKRVRLYFQYNRYPTNEPVDYTNFFVQDVYKGGTTPLNDGSDDKSQYSKEVYSFDGGTRIEAGSAHMDKLTAGSDDDHINNYNNAHCSTNDNVWDGRTYEEGWPITSQQEADQRGVGDWETENYNHIVFHSDEIMLMENSKTDCFGWFESNGSIQHDDQYVIISGATIDAWATKFANDNPNINISDLGESVTGRGFVGFDYESVPQTDAYTDQYYTAPDGTRVKYLRAETNMYSTSDIQYGVETDAKRLELLGKGYLPVWSSADKTWARLGKFADGYYSDWIVCIVEAQGKTITSREKIEKDGEFYKIPVKPQCGRIFCEDLGVSTREDLDYNDVVFDVDVYQNYEAGVKRYYTIYSDGRKVLTDTKNYSTLDQATYSCKITLQAAGGTLPLTVIGKEVHEMFGVGVTTMVNTRDDNSTAFGSYVTGKAPVDLGEYTTSQLFPEKKDTDPIYAREIPIVVNYNTAKQVAILGAEKGNAPAKLFVPNQSTKWTVERKPLVVAYPKFAKYVGDGEGVVQWWVDDVSHSSEDALVEYYRYNNISYKPIVTPPVVITRITYPAVSQDNLWPNELPYDAAKGPYQYSAWSVKDCILFLPEGAKEFYPGDYLTFYGEDLDDDSYITVVFYGGNSKPYFIDTRFLNYDVDSKGNMTKKTSGVVEVKLDETNAEKINKSIKDGKLTIQVQGRNFKLTRIGRTLFQ